VLIAIAATDCEWTERCIAPEARITDWLAARP
jgi:hypothetical protein